MKTTCKHTGLPEDVAERDILAYIERSGAFRARVARLLGRLTGSQGGKRSLQTMTPEQRQERARNAVAAREAKRKTLPGRDQTPNWHIPNEQENTDHHCKRCGRRIVFLADHGKWFDPTVPWESEASLICYTNNEKH